MDGVTPVSLSFGEGGLMVTSLKDGKPFVRTLTWKELYKIGLKGKRMDKNAFLKKVSERAEKVLKANRESEANHQKHMKQLLDLRNRSTQLRPSLPPNLPLPPAATAP